MRTALALSTRSVAFTTGRVCRSAKPSSSMTQRPSGAARRAPPPAAAKAGPSSNLPEPGRQQELQQAAAEPSFELLGEQVVYSRYLTLYSRSVRFPPPAPGQDGPVHEFDTIGHPRANFRFCVTFPWHPATKEVTLIREYAQGPNALAYCLPTGAFDPRKHAGWRECARAELSEEARLAGGEWACLLPEGHQGIPEVKWCANRFYPFVCMDPQPDAAPGQRDREEFIQVLRVGVPELRRLMRGGDMLLPSVTTCHWALEWLEERGML